MTTLGHGLRTAPTLGTSPATVRRRARGLLAAVTGNAYLRLLAAVVAIAVGAAVVTMGIVGVMDLVIPWVFGDTLHALSVLLPR